MADFFKGLHTENTVDYAEKYLLKDSAEQNEEVVDREESGGVEVGIEETPLYQI